MLATALTLSAAVGAGVAASTASADDGAASAPKPPETAARPIAVKAGPIAGTIVALDGKTPVPGARIALFDREGRKIAEATANEAGRFDLPAQPAGEYRFAVGKAIGVLRLDEAAKATSVVLLMPAEVALAIRDAQAETVSILGVEMSEEAAGAIGLGVVTAAAAGTSVGIWQYREDAEDDRERRHAKPPVSPTNP